MNRELFAGDEIIDIGAIEFINISVDDLIKNHATALDELYAGDKVGFLVKNFLSKSEVNAIVDNLQKLLPFKDVALTGEGLTYPMVFSEFSDKNKVEGKLDKKLCDKYFQFCESYDSEFIADFGFSLQSKIQNLLASVANGKSVKVPVGYDNVGQFPFGNFRFLKPQVGKIPFHCGNYFQSEFKSFYEYLERSLLVVDQLSYFVMLQKPDKGGDLEVFNLKWQSGQTKKSAREDYQVILADGEMLYPDENLQCNKILISPEPGDLILFQGGNIWHRVSQVLGEKSRITFGGFMAINKEKDSYYYWS